MGIKLVLGRGYGKTTQLVKLASKKGSVIICDNNRHVEYVKKIANELGLPIKEPATIDELFRGNFISASGPKNFVIDDAERFIDSVVSRLSLYGGVEGIAITYDNRTIVGSQSSTFLDERFQDE